MARSIIKSANPQMFGQGLHSLDAERFSLLKIKSANKSYQRTLIHNICSLGNFKILTETEKKHSFYKVHLWSDVWKFTVYLVESSQTPNLLFSLTKKHRMNSLNV